MDHRTEALRTTNATESVKGVVDEDETIRVWPYPIRPGALDAPRSGSALRTDSRYPAGRGALPSRIPKDQSRGKDPCPRRRRPGAHRVCSDRALFGGKIFR